MVGEYVYVPLAVIVTVPCDGAELAVTVSEVPLSLVRTEVPLSTVLADVLPTLLAATGVTAMVTVAVVV